jgi:hypothetical protein
MSNEERDELKRLSKGNLQPFSQVVNEFRSRRNCNQSRNNSSAGTPTGYKLMEWISEQAETREPTGARYWSRL